MNFSDLKTIKNERENFLNLFKQTPEIMCLLRGPSHVFEFVNDAHIRLLGFDAVGKTIRQAQPESVEIHHLLDDVFETGETAELYEIPITVGTRVRYFNLTFVAHSDVDERINGVVVLGIEVTDQYLTREMLKGQNIALQMTMDGAPLKEVLDVLALAIEKHLSGGVLSSILLMSSDGKNLKHGAAPSLSSEYNKAVECLPIGPLAGACGAAAYLRREVWVSDIASDPLCRDFRELASKNSLKSCWSTPIFDSKAEVIGTFALYNRPPIDPNSEEQLVFNLITQTVGLILERESDTKKRLYTEKALHKSEALYHSSEEQLSMAIDVAKVGFYDWNIKKDTVTLSPQMLKDWDMEDGVRSLEDALDKIHPDDREQVRRLIENTVEHDAPYHTVYRVVKNDGKNEWMELRGKLERDNKGMPYRFFGTCVVVTEQKEREASLRNAQQVAENASTAKGLFLANMSHEIRTPLGAISGFLELLKNPTISRNEIKEYVGIIDRSSKQLLRIVDEVLDLSKIEAGKFIIDPIDFSLVELLHDFNSLMAFKAREKGLVFDLIIESSFPSSVYGDPTRFRQILSNLVGNAIKFTTKGHVFVKISYCQPNLRIEVEDSGCGISQDAKNKLFKPFSQGDDSTTRNYGGSGLGLHLTKRLSEAMQGQFFLKESSVGVGSVFSVELPLPASSQSQMIDSSSFKPEIKESSPQSQPLLPAQKILVVEDAYENQRLIKILLKSWGSDPKVATNGKESIEMTKNQDFDLILMDIQMPVMDGYEATKLLRKNGYQGPIVALTAHAMVDEKRKCLESGFNSFLSKPINQDDLYNTLLTFSSFVPPVSLP